MSITQIQTQKTHTIVDFLAKDSVFSKASYLYRRARERLSKTGRVSDFDKSQWWWIEGLSRDMRLFLVNLCIARFGHWRTAEYLRKSRGTVADWASGKKLPSNESMIQIINLLRRSLSRDEWLHLVELIATDLAENIRLLLVSLGYEEEVAQRIYEAARRELAGFFQV